MEERLRLARIEKYGPGSEKLSDAQSSSADEDDKQMEGDKQAVIKRKIASYVAEKPSLRFDQALDL